MPYPILTLPFHVSPDKKVSIASWAPLVWGNVNKFICEIILWNAGPLQTFVNSLCEYCRGWSVAASVPQPKIYLDLDFFGILVWYLSPPLLCLTNTWRVAGQAAPCAVTGWHSMCAGYPDCTNAVCPAVMRHNVLPENWWMWCRWLIYFNSTLISFRHKDWAGVKDVFTR